MARPYERLVVANFNAQTGDERYPPRRGPGEDEDDERKPKVAWWRSNLVAASQRFNLYFAAFKDKVHVYIPRDIDQLIPSLPDAILDLPVSEKATRGYLDPEYPHAVNHMKVGNMGNREVLFMACDDGDVLAFYTHVLHHHTEELPLDATTGPVSTVAPFFHENVGITAWGLAIHEQSRLLAVGSNNREVTVFMHAYTEFGPGRRFSDDPNTANYKHGVMQTEIIAGRMKDKFRMLYIPQERHIVTSQFANIAMPLDLGQRGHNIPSIDFLSYEDGEASHIIAADIFGHCWYLALDTSEKRYDARLRSEPRDDPNNMGWGVINLPLSYFKKVTNSHDAIGAHQPSSGLRNLINAEADRLSPKPKTRNKPDFNTPQRSAVLRTFNHDIQLLPPTYAQWDMFKDSKPAAVVFRDLVKDEAGLSAVLQEIHHMDRLNMFAVIPELNLVVLASQIGRAAVMTLTRLPDNASNEPVTMMRRDAILPLPEHATKYRPDMPLLGMAIAPIKRTNPENERWQAERKVFRLFLHYMDHSILSYEISRENNDELRFF